MVGFVTEPQDCVGEYFARQLAWSKHLGEQEQWHCSCVSVTAELRRCGPNYTPGEEKIK